MSDLTLKDEVLGLAEEFADKGRHAAHACLFKAADRIAELERELAEAKEREAKDYAELADRFEKVHVQNVLSASRVAELEHEKAELVAFVDEYLEAWADGMAGDSYLLRAAEKLKIKRNTPPATSTAHPPAGTLIDEGSKIASNGAEKGGAA